MRNQIEEADTVCLLDYGALFCEGKKDLLGSRFGNSTLEVGGDIYRTEGAIHLEYR